jgi:hypothetical protein
VLRCSAQREELDVMVEYAILVGAMALGGAIGLVGVGIALVDNFDLVRSLILAPIP